MNPDPPRRTDQDQLPDGLAQLLRQVDPVPANVVEAARSSFGWRTLESELAQLTADSLLVSADVRGEQPRMLTYQAGERTIEAEVSDLGGRLRILGQLSPPQPARVRADQPAGAAGVEVVADSLGRFSIGGLPSGPTRLVCQPLGPDGEPAGAEVHGEWLVL
jgi:hypothetical protein